jgi:hypothetical protein
MNLKIRRVKFYSPLLAALALAVANLAVAQNIDPVGVESVEVKGGAGKRVSQYEELLETKDLSMFRGYQTEEIPAGWKLQGKTLMFDGKGSGDIITRETYKDFELQVEWSISPGGNSGIMYRVGLGDDQPYLTGPEIQILDDETAGSNPNPLHLSGALYDLYPAENSKLKPAGQWNKSRIIVQGNTVSHRLNGVTVFEVEMGSDDWNEKMARSKFKDWPKFNKLEEGHICFQNHGHEVKFRGIRIKRLTDGSAADDDDEEDGPPNQGSGTNPNQGAGANFPPVDEGVTKPQSRPGGGPAQPPRQGGGGIR